MKVVLLILTVFLTFTSVHSAKGDERLSFSYSKSQGIGYDVQIINRSNVPLTAFLILSQHFSHSGGIDRIYLWTDSVLNSWIDKPVQPMESRVIKIGPAGKPGHEAIGINLLAAIFEDGTTVGDAAFVDRFLKQRKMVYSDILTSIPIIDEAKSQPDPTPFVKLRMEELKQRNLSTISDSLDRDIVRPAANTIPSTVIVNLESKTKRGIDPKTALEEIVVILRQRKSHLQQSKPSLE